MDLIIPSLFVYKVNEMSNVYIQLLGMNESGKINGLPFLFLFIPSSSEPPLSRNSYENNISPTANQ